MRPWLRRRAAPTPDELVIHTGVEPVHFETRSAIAKRWFYPRYADGSPHEKPVLDALVRALRPDSCFLDVGSHVGFYAAIACRLFPGASVHAFEIDPLLIPEILGNVARNERANATATCAAVWDSTGEVCCFTPSSAGNPSTNQVVPVHPKGAIASSTLRLDDYCGQLGLRPDVVKIDVEGAEARVLRGLGDLLGGLRLLLLELHPNWLERFDTDIGDVVRLLGAHAFRVQRLVDHRSRTSETLPIAVEALRDVEDNCMLICERS